MTPFSEGEQDVGVERDNEEIQEAAEDGTQAVDGGLFAEAEDLVEHAKRISDGDVRKPAVHGRRGLKEVALPCSSRRARMKPHRGSEGPDKFANSCAALFLLPKL